ncbi:molybdenum cofactor cytidylyltransferase [Evansella vedderi]|uniref:Molybdenum cofactor cytidylyltransferase n=1 Tax=Evansella vedderi TaxID=38282 RepID=A0ABT9ZQF0_9BACI|nr:nucleotidyltransferase family protein [Evansella vedderi]MDQ0253471.1 molybdenum cofactor cytidylyltransferase [Evansella vedderi]
MNQNNISAVILAAGMSSRMGRGKAKQLLQLSGESILERVIKKIQTHPFSKIIVVVGHEREKIKSQININDPRLIWLDNDEYKLGQHHSFKKGMEASLSHQQEGVMFFLGDQPFIQNKVISRIMGNGAERLEKEQTPFAIRPHHKGRPGHPVFFGNISKLHTTWNKGGRALWRSMEEKEMIHLEDPYIHFDVDTPDDYQRAQRIVLELEKGKWEN